MKKRQNHLDWRSVTGLFPPAGITRRTEVKSRGWVGGGLRCVDIGVLSLTVKEEESR